MAYLVSGYTPPIFTIFSPYESTLGEMIDLYLVFQYVKGRCHDIELIFGKCHDHRLIKLAFFALSLENKLQYHFLNVRINSVDDMATSCENLVNFCLVTPVQR